jgi:hypothetical protein
MAEIVSYIQDLGNYFFHTFHYHPEHINNEIQIESSRKYRNAVVCRLLRFRDRVHEDDLLTYWEIIDEMLDLSLGSAIQLLQNIYEYHVRKLQPNESRREYPQISNELYRLEYDDEQGVFRDVCAGALLNEAIDLLQEEADRLIREV